MKRLNNNKINCFSCNKELENWTYESNSGDGMIEVHPMGGLHFHTRGHYGSSIFDPMGTCETLDIAICDSCVLDNLHKVRGRGKKEIAENLDMFVEYVSQPRAMLKR
jgi:hypothetical protein